jgi:hypothetical protein
MLEFVPIVVIVIAGILAIGHFHMAKKEDFNDIR